MQYAQKILALLQEANALGVSVTNVVLAVVCAYLAKIIGDLRTVLREYQANAREDKLWLQKQFEEQSKK